MALHEYHRGQDRNADAALDSGLGILEKEQKKQTRKVVFKLIVSQIVTGLLLILKIMIPIILVLTIYVTSLADGLRVILLLVVESTNSVEILPSSSSVWEASQSLKSSSASCNLSFASSSFSRIISNC